MTFNEVITKYGYPFISKEVAKIIECCRHSEEKGKKPQWIQDRLFNGYWEGSKYDYRKYQSLLKAPFLISNKCCEINKEKPLHKYQKESKKVAIIGMMASESQRRASSWLYTGCNAFDIKIPSSRPLMIWTEKDILEYIVRNNIKIAKEYGEIKYEKTFIEDYKNIHLTGAKRTGCIMCLMGISSDRDRMLRIKEQTPKVYDYMMRGGAFDTDGYWKPTREGLGYKFIIDWLNNNIETFIKKPILY